MIRIKPYPFLYTLFDMLLVPGMYLIAGVFNEKPQETHAYNVQSIPFEQKSAINPVRGVSLKGAYRGFLGKRHGGILFHIPIFGGWKEYVVFEADTEKPWHLGWCVDGMTKDYFQVSRLTIEDTHVRALKPPVGTTTLFFALDDNGSQVPLKRIGEGVIGDRKFPKIRLL